MMDRRKNHTGGFIVEGFDARGRASRPSGGNGRLGTYLSRSASAVRARGNGRSRSSRRRGWRRKPSREMRRLKNRRREKNEKMKIFVPPFLSSPPLPHRPLFFKKRSDAQSITSFRSNANQKSQINTHCRGSGLDPCPSTKTSLPSLLAPSLHLDPRPPRPRGPSAPERWSSSG